MEAHARIRRGYLEIEGRGLYHLLLVAVQPGKAVGEGIRYEELHGSIRRWGKLHCRHSFPGMMRFMNSSNKGTVKAVSP